MDKTTRGYHEKKHIVQKHVQTENLLINQGKQLINVAYTAAKDVNKLHETIARRQVHEYNNRETFKNLDNQLRSHLDTMTTNITEHKTMLSDQTGSLLIKMGKRLMMQLSFLNRVHIDLSVGFCKIYRYQHKSK